MKILELLLGLYWTCSLCLLIWGICDGTPNGDYAVKISIMPFVVLSAFFLFFAYSDSRKNRVK